MSHLSTPSRKYPTLAALPLALLALLLSACGSSGSTTTTSASATSASAGRSSGANSSGANSSGANSSGANSSGAASSGAASSGAASSATTPAAKGGSTATTPGAPGQPGGPGGSGGTTRFGKVRECLRKQGVTLPKFRPTSPRGPRGILRPNTGPQLPKGMTRAQFEAAIEKCGGGSFAKRRFFGASARLRNPLYRKRLSRFASCMRKNGVQLPEPNTSGTGPIFDTRGIDATSAKFRAVQRKCATELRPQPGSAAG
ncbi:MAG TPA: hypothetical protein VMG62_01570 [Solirubrobacteraceae bacterium]|nr:hypothetical protein [Solirubrobacteraceae bacterium]